MLALGVMAVMGLTPVLAHAQFQVNGLYGKTFPEVSKMLGQPVEKSPTPPVTYSRFKTPGALDTIVWYNFDSGLVGKVQIQILPKPGDTPDSVLKRYGLSVGSNPHTFDLKKPAQAMSSNGAVPGMPWSKIYISYINAMSFKTELVAYCKEHHLDPSKTYFWTIQVTNRRGGGGGNMMSSGDAGGGGGSKGGGSKGGKKGGHKKG